MDNRFSYMIKAHRGVLLINLISRFYPLSEELRKKYKWILNEKLLDANENDNLSIDYKNLDEYNVKGLVEIFGDLISKNEVMKWEVDYLELYQNELDWKNLSLNKALPWSEDLIRKYSDKWNWTYLSANSGLSWGEGLIETFNDKWVWLEYNEQAELEKDQMMGLVTNSGIKWDESLIDKYYDKLSKNSRWDALTMNDGVQWTDALFKKYDWDVKCLSGSDSFPLSNQFIEHNADNMHWMRISMRSNVDWSFIIENYWDRIDSYFFLDDPVMRMDISMNPNFPWDNRLFEMYFKKLNECVRIDPNNEHMWDQQDDDEDAKGFVYRVVDTAISKLSENKGIYDKYFKDLTSEEIDELISTVIRYRNEIQNKIQTRKNRISDSNDNWSDLTQDPLYDTNKDWDQQDPEIW